MSEEISAWVGQVGDRHGFTGGVQVRPPEVISGASGVQTSTGENTYETMEEGTDFAAGSRENAQANDHDQAGSHYGEGANPMQSPDLGGEFALRYGIGFLCSDYQTWNDLGDIAQLTQPQSAYLRAFAGMNKKKQYRNPTTAQMRTYMNQWIQRLGNDLPDGTQGELVVSFQGHGENGSIYGVDEQELSTSAMLSIANGATSSRVSMTYMLDACFSGNAIAAFQNNAADAVDQNVDSSDSGSGEGHANAEHLRDQMAHARELINMSEAVGRLGDQLTRHTDAIELNNDEAAWDAAMALNGQIISSIEAMQNQFETNMNFAPHPALRGIERAFSETLTFLGGIEPMTCFDFSQWVARVGRFQDRVSDGANSIISDLSSRAR